MKTIILIIVAVVLLCCSVTALIQCHRLADLDRKNAITTVDAINHMQSHLDTLQQKLEFQQQLLEDPQSLEDTLSQIKAGEASGQLTHEKAQYLRDVLVGKITTYVNSKGEVTTNQFGN